MKRPNGNGLIAALVQAAKAPMRQLSETEAATTKAATKATRLARDVRDEIAKAPDLKRFERKLDILERRSFAESKTV